MSASTIDPATKANTLECIKQWPVHDRVDLVQSILASIGKEDSTRPSREGVRALLGCWQDIQPTPSDADVKRMLEEERIRKFS